MVREGAETPLFKQNFTDWLNKGEITGLPVYEKKGELCGVVRKGCCARVPLDVSACLCACSAVREEVKVEGASMHQQAARESEKMVDDGSGNIQVRVGAEAWVGCCGLLQCCCCLVPCSPQIWRIEDFEPQPVPPEMYGQFYGGDSYIVLYTYLVNGKENYIIYFWLGQESSQVGVGQGRGGEAR